MIYGLRDPSSSYPPKIGRRKGRGDGRGWGWQRKEERKGKSSISQDPCSLEQLPIFSWRNCLGIASLRPPQNWQIGPVLSHFFHKHEAQASALRSPSLAGAPTVLGSVSFITGTKDPGTNISSFHLVSALSPTTFLRAVYILIVTSHQMQSGSSRTSEFWNQHRAVSEVWASQSHSHSLNSPFLIISLLQFLSLTNILTCYGKSSCALTP